MGEKRNWFILLGEKHVALTLQMFKSGIKALRIPLQRHWWTRWPLRPHCQIMTRYGWVARPLSIHTHRTLWVMPCVHYVYLLQRLCECSCTGWPTPRTLSPDRWCRASSPVWSPPPSPLNMAVGNGGSVTLRSFENYDQNITEASKSIKLNAAFVTSSKSNRSCVIESFFSQTEQPSLRVIEGKKELTALPSRESEGVRSTWLKEKHSRRQWQPQ